jgi:CTP:molybdopterin cytidylyltransferase MocA
MGRTKALLDFGGRPLILRVIDSLRQAHGIAPVVIVTGHEPALVVAAVDDPKISNVDNPHYESGGMISSIQAGLRVVQQECSAFFVVLADHAPPLPHTLSLMMQTQTETGSLIVLPTFRGKHGHPILVSSLLAPDILALSNQQSLATIVQSHRAKTRDLDVQDEAVLEDIDTPQDYNLALKRWNERNERNKANRSGT